jgi:aspartate/methionine/tyrosine aminotransferase
VREQMITAGVELTDLTDTNPTRHHLFDSRISEVVSRHALQANRYEPTPRGPWPARAALADRFGGDPQDYWLTASTSEAYGWLFALLSDPGQAVAIPSPGYPLLEPLARWQSIRTMSYRTLYAHPSGWELDRDDLERVVSDPATTAVVAVNPNNPTGAYVENSLVEVASAAELPIIADEVFFSYALPSSSTSLGSSALPNPANDRGGSRQPTTHQRIAGTTTTLTFGLDGLSKLLAAPQLKLGWIRLSGPQAETKVAARALDQIADSYLSVNAPVALALPELLGLADDCVAMVTRRLTTNLATAQQSFGDYRIRTTHGGWMMLLDVPPIMDPDALVIALMSRAALSVHPGYFYDLPDTTLAISLLPEPGVFEESCRRLSAALTVLADEVTASAGAAGGTV